MIVRCLLQVYRVDQVLASNASNVIVLGAVAIKRQKYQSQDGGSSPEMAQLLLLHKMNELLNVLCEVLRRQLPIMYCARLR